MNSITQGTFIVLKMNKTGMTQIAKPTIQNTQFKAVAKPVLQEKPKFPTIILIPPSPAKQVEVPTIKLTDVIQPKSSLKLEDYLPLVNLGVIVLFVMSRNNK